MKQKLLFTLLFLPLWGAGGLCAFAATVLPISANFTNHTVTLTVTGTTAKTWVWIDYVPVNDVAPFVTGTWGRAGVTAVSAGTLVGGNTRGFWLMGGVTATATLAVTGKFNWCAYASDAPPTAVINPAGGYTLKGTAPFTINGTITESAKTFGAGTCITSLTDYTGNPDGIVPPLPTVSTTSPAARCGAGAVTLTATAGGGFTDAMTYTWNVGGTTYTTTTNSYTTVSLAASTTYSVQLTNANNCISAASSGAITVNYPGADGQVPGTCDCAVGTTNCSGTCKTNTTYTTNDGACTGACNTAYVQLRNQCGIVTNSAYGTYSNTSCTSGCVKCSEARVCHSANYYTTQSCCLAACQELGCGWDAAEGWVAPVYTCQCKDI